MLKSGCLAAFLCIALIPMSKTTADFVNGGFEDGSFNGWIVEDLPNPFFPITVATSGSANTFGWPWSSTPTEGDFVAYHGFDGDPAGSSGVISLAQDLVVTGTTLEFDYRYAFDLTFGGATQPRTFDVNIETSGGGTVLQSFNLVTALPFDTLLDSGDVSAALDVSAFLGQAVRISFDWTVPDPFSGPAAFQLDDVQIEPVPEPGTAALLGLGMFGLLRRRR